MRSGGGGVVIAPLSRGKGFEPVPLPHEPRPEPRHAPSPASGVGTAAAMTADGHLHRQPAWKGLLSGNHQYDEINLTLLPSILLNEGKSVNFLDN
ncbi:hypothetical protein EVAR_89176_1 [Eumeta japonica]|uniref:Uncharacterized protein n=1 Tax=Eumeta variegata TaxID=151549 RepID=A0A4C1YBS6_EUMVA|nr:hypothetical protein EVAR_89176_1 [Eumeta japonica]